MRWDDPEGGFGAARLKPWGRELQGKEEDSLTKGWGAIKYQMEIQQIWCGVHDTKPSSNLPVESSANSESLSC